MSFLDGEDQDALRRFNYSQSFEQLDSVYQNDKKSTYRLSLIMMAKFKGALYSYQGWSAVRYSKRGIKDKLFGSKKWKDIDRADGRVTRSLASYPGIQSAWYNIEASLRIRSVPGRPQNEVKATYYAFAAQMHILDQQIVHPIEQALQTNADDIVGGRENLVRVATAIYHEILVALEVVYIQVRRCWTPIILSRPFCRLAESIQHNPNFKFTADKVQSPAKLSPDGTWFQSPAKLSPDGTWFRCLECLGVVKGYWNHTLSEYDLAGSFVGHLIPLKPLEEVPVACPDCKEEFKYPERLALHVKDTKWEGRHC